MESKDKILNRLKPGAFDAERAGKFSLDRAKGNLASRSKIERALNADAEARTVEFAFASSNAIEHWFGFLILDTDKKSVVLDRVTNGVCPHLVNHDTNQQVGVVVSDSIELGDMVRGKVKFSRSDEAQRILDDIVDEIRVGVSFGFLVHDMVLESDSDGIPTYRATKWEIIETTSASIPADISVGMGRELYYSMDDEDFEETEAREKAEKKEETESRSGEENSEKTVSEDASERSANSNDEENMTEEEKRQAAERALASARLQDFREVGEFFGETELARSFEADGKTVAEFRAAIVEKRAAKESKVPAKPIIEFSKKEEKEYSLARAILADANIRDGQRVSSFESEVSDTLRRELNAPGITLRGGILIPTNVPMVKRAGLDTASATKGQTTVYTEFGGSLIELLRNKAMVMLLGATVLPGLQGNVSFPRQSGGATATWVGENPGSDVGESNLTLDSISLSPKTLQSTTSYSRQLLAQSVIDVDSIVADDLALVNALAIDKAALHGTGSSNQPQGIYAGSVNSVAFGGSVTFAKLVDMETEIALDNADFGTMAYLTTPGVKGKAKQVAELSNTVNNAIWRGGEMNGIRAEASNQIAKNLGAGTNEHGIILGVWSELLIGEWGVMEIITDPYRLKKQGMIEVTTFNMVDIARRHDEAFCKGTGLIP